MPRWAITLGVVALVLLATILIIKFMPSDDQQAGTPTPVVQTPAHPVSIEANTLFLGDIYWGRTVNQWSMASDLKTAYPFSRLSEFNRDSYDSWVANLECPTVAGFTQTPQQEEATLSFNCNPDYLPEMAKWFPIVSLANNHTDNRGADGFTETKQHLEENNVQYFGHYDPAVADDACDVISLPVTVTYSDKSTKHQFLPVAMCGYNGVFKIPPAATLERIADYSKYMPVIAMPHMGTEYREGPDQLKTSVYRSMIDYGADMVLGGHPHWVQSSEAYNGKLIVYSMGNFIFDQQFDREVTRSASIGVVMKTTDATPDQLTQWLALGEQCKGYQDDCLSQAAAKNLSKLNFSYEYSVVGSNSADKITKPAAPDEQQAILQRLDWQNTINQLQPPQYGR